MTIFSRVFSFLLKDNLVQFEKAEEIFDSKEEIYVPVEIIAEVVYVLQKVYSIPRGEITSEVIKFLEYDNVHINDSLIIKNALKTYENSNLDYADCIVYSHSQSKECDIFTFDKGLLRFYNKNK